MDIREEIEYDWEEANTALSTTPPSTSTTQSTTTAKQVTTSLRPSPTPLTQKFHYRPEAVAVSTTTPNTVLQLLALHEAFQENLNRRDPQGNKFPLSAPSTQKTTPKTSPVHPYQLSNAPQSHYTAHSNKLPNSVSNLSQNVHFSNLAPNRNPPQTAYKPEPPHIYYNKQHSQKVTNKTNYPPTQPAKNQNDEAIYAYKILSNDGPSRFRSNTLPNKPAETFKMQPVPQLAHSTFTIAQNRPYVFRSKMSLEEDTESENSETDEQRTQKLDNFPHTNFARAIPDRNPVPKNASDSVSVVLTTSSVSSSVSSKPRSAISNNSVAVSNPTRNSFVSNSSNTLSTKLKEVPQSTFNYPNITDINESLTEESYYEDGRADYDDNQEYKDIVYQTDVQKIKQ